MQKPEKSDGHFSALTADRRQLDEYLRDLSTAPRSRGTGVFAGSLSVSFVLHVAVLLAALGWSSIYSRPTPDTNLERTALDLTLVPLVPRAPESIPEQDPQPIIPEPLPAKTKAETSEVLLPDTEVASQATPAELPNEFSSPTPAPLNLSRPSEWQSLALDPPEQQGALVFKRSTRQALVKRRAEQDAAQALTRSQIARLGLPAEQFRRLSDAGEEVKTDKGCFVKRTENSLSGRQERWWRTACKDSRKPQWRREVLSFGPDHRVDSAHHID